MLRIGINLGDVMTEGGDLYGDGVNIAARLESAAEPGAILISGTVFDQSGAAVAGASVRISGEPMPAGRTTSHADAPKLSSAQ